MNHILKEMCTSDTHTCESLERSSENRSISNLYYTLYYIKIELHDKLSIINIKILFIVLIQLIIIYF